MANVNEAVNYLEQLMVEGIEGPALDAFLSLSDKEIPTQYRKKTDSQKITALTAQYKAFHTHMDQLDDNNPLQLNDQSNHDGADAVKGEYDIELKFGMETNANIGLGTFFSIFELGESLFDYWTVEARNYRKALYSSELTEEVDILAHNQRALEHIAHHFNQIYSDLTPDQVGKVNQVITGSGSVRHKTDRPYRKYVFTAKGVEEVEPLPVSAAYISTATVSERGRFTLTLMGDALVVKFVLNGKNTVRYTTEDGRKVKFSAKTLLGSPNFNVFVSEVKDG